MKPNTAVRAGLCLALTCCPLISTEAGVFLGTNVPGASSAFSVNLSVGSTNLAASVPGNPGAYSYLYLRRGAPATESLFDFASRLDGRTNGIYLETPEVTPDTWHFLVKTPPGSAAHEFVLTVDPNQPGLRQADRPVAKLLPGQATGVSSNNTREFFQVELSTNSGWQVRLEAAGHSLPDLYVNRGQIPWESAYLKRSLGVTNDSIAFLPAEVVPGLHYLAVLAGSLPTNIPYTLHLEPLLVRTLNWDPGLTHAGTEVFTNFSGLPGDYYFRITTANPALGAWRTALRVTSGEASLYLSRGQLPTPFAADYRSEQTGSDGFVISSSRFSPSEDWYLLVKASEGAQWTLVSGAPYVADLGTVATNDTSGSGPVEIGPEGMRYFKATAPPNMLAWRLWLQGSNNMIFLRKNSVPLSNENEGNQAGQMLVVPPYLDGGQQYFIGVAGRPHEIINLDSRHQAILSLAYGSTVSSTVTGYGYVTYRVEVPPNQIAWQLTLPFTNGNPNLAVRRSNVPNENYNDAISELPTNNLDHITLVPPLQPNQPGLSDGTFYLTVYSSNAFHFSLINEPAVVTDVHYTATLTNDQPARVGWRFYRVTDIAEQLGSLGWDLLLTNSTLGTRLAVRRNAAPGIWNQRNPSLLPVNYYDALSTADFLQRPDHQADVWYVGIYNPTNVLGDVTLILRELQALTLGDNAALQRTNLLAGRWDFFKMQVPAGLTNGAGQPILGWDVRINVSEGSPRLVIRRDGFPTSVNTTLNPYDTTWVSGRQWAAASDWTRRTFSFDGLTNEDGRILAMGIARPLEPGNYYLGILDPLTTNSGSYTIHSRWIGPEQAIPVRDLPWSAGIITNSVQPREADYYRVILPTNVPSWRVRLRTLSGEAMLLAISNAVPNVLSERRMQKLAAEQYLKLPAPGDATLVPGTNYLAVIGEGQSPYALNRIGLGATTYALETIGVLPVLPLGNVGPADLIYTDSMLEGGACRAFNFHMLPPSKGVWILLEPTLGNPWMSAVPGLVLPDPSLGGDYYGTEGGEVYGANHSGSMLIGLGNIPDVSVTVKARSIFGEHPNASYTLRVREIVPEVVGFNHGSSTVVDYPSDSGKFFYIDVPADALGWDLRLQNVTGGYPRLYIRRGEYLPHPNVGAVMSLSGTNWWEGWQYNVGTDWTDRYLDAEGNYEDGRVFVAGLGHPLEPGRYCVGVYGTYLSETMSFTLVSRGIGPNHAIPVPDLNFAGGSAQTNALPREAAYYRVTIPPNTASWKVSLSAFNGESMLAAYKGALPNVGANVYASVIGWSAGKKMQKTGDEQFLLLPDPGETYLRPGDYFLAAVSEGVDATNSARIGVGQSQFVVNSLGSASVHQLGTIGFFDTTVTHSLAAGEVQLYQFSVPPNTLNLEARLEQVTGFPVLTLVPGSRAPNPSALHANVMPETPIYYGTEGGENPHQNVTASVLNIANPSNGVHILAVKARGYFTAFSNTVFTLRLNASGASLVDFDTGSMSVSNQSATTPRYFRVVVPTNALGWDLRLLNVVTGMPRMVVCREALPVNLATTWGAGLATSWPSNAQWAPGPDWTRRNLSLENVDETGRVLAMGLGRPLEPGTYYVAVLSGHPWMPMSYTLASRGIGPGFSLPVLDLPFVGSVTHSGLAPREAAYYRVTVPTNTPAWKVSLTGLTGESMMAILRDGLPNIDSVVGQNLTQGKGMQKLGNEHFLALPVIGFSNVPPGAHYIAVVSEGLNPGAGNRIGTGPSSFILRSEGTIPVTHLGMITSEDLVRADTLDGGECKAYRFLVPAGTYGVKLLLENRVGNPVLTVRQGDALPDPGTASATAPPDSYGNDGGYTGGDAHPTYITVPNSGPGYYSVIVKGRRQPNGSTPDCSYTLRLQEVLVPWLNFSSSENSNGLTNAVSALLQDNERAFFRVVIPAELHGRPVIGWKLDLMQSSGQAQMRVRRDLLPSDAQAGLLMPFTSSSAIIAPPYLTNSVWYVEVKGNGSTAFTLTSSPLEPERPAWVMPAPGQTNVAPGLTWPVFGDTGIDTNGTSLPGDQSIFLEQGFLHYYAVEVPTNNNGLLRLQLDAISGNPDLYARAGAIPTLYHNTAGAAGSIYDRTMLANGTEYANWVPLDGKREEVLTPGTWYLAVRAAGNANARYRLRTSVGSISDLPMHGPGLTNQTLASGDWRYYRIRVPSVVPFDFNLNFSQQSGDVWVYVRDIVPPGNGTHGLDYRDWRYDYKNDGPYDSYDLSGSYRLTVPPVMPGHVYYFGVRAVSDAVFSLGVTTNGTVGLEPIALAFYGGTAATNVAPHSRVLYRVDVPAEGVRWRHFATHPVELTLYLEHGTVPAGSYSDTWRSGSANSQLNIPLVGPWSPALHQYQPGFWPWMPGQPYYLLVTNPSPNVQPFAILMEGRHIYSDDNDMDGLLDEWEYRYFGHLGHIGSTDPDLDGVDNAAEAQEGTHPNDGTSFRARLVTYALFGTVQREPNYVSYPLGSEVTLTPVPDPGYSFGGWSGQASGRADPLVLTMNAHKTNIVALFKLAGDDFVTALPLAGAAVIVQGSNVGMTKEPGEPFHAGNPGGKSIWWCWRAPASGQVSLSTAGSGFNTLLGVYTGLSVSNLACLASDYNAQGGTNRSNVSFGATAGTSYYVAVDGHNAGSGRIMLTLQQGGAGGPCILGPIERMPDDSIRLRVWGDPNCGYQIQISTNLVDWSSAGSVTTGSDGSGWFVDPTAGQRPAGFYRSRTQ